MMCDCSNASALKDADLTEHLLCGQLGDRESRCCSDINRTAVRHQLWDACELIGRLLHNQSVNLSGDTSVHHVVLTTKGPLWGCCVAVGRPMVSDRQG
jgi:hypothetical protein